MALLVPEMGVFSALAGLAWIVLLIPLQNLAAKRIGLVRRGMIATTDERVKLTNEILTSIRAIKLYGWELPMMQRVLTERRKELKQLQRYLLNSSYLRELLFAAGPVATLVIFTVHIYAQKEPISVAQVFRVLAFINILRFPLNLLGQALKNFSDAAVSVQRLDRFLLLPVLATPDFAPADTGDAAAAAPFISIKETTFSWEDSGDAKSGSGFLLRIDNFHTRHAHGQQQKKNTGELIAVIGAVGSGKSTFFSAMLNELPVVPSTSAVSSVRRAGAVAYCAQSAWIQNLTLKKNVLFGLADDDLGVLTAYQVALGAAALGPDLAILPHGDETEIGERGITLSGGQKQRVAIARALLAAVTNNASIILFDDSLSACDSTTAQHIFTHGIVGLCKDKICMVALNSHLHLLGQFHRVLVMDAGAIACDGTLAEVWVTDKGREVLTQAGLKELPAQPPPPTTTASTASATTTTAPPATTTPATTTTATTAAATTTAAASAPAAVAAAAASPVNAASPSAVLIQQEKRAVGAVTSALYVRYFSSGFSSVADLTESTIYTDPSPPSSILKTIYGLFVATVLMVLFAISQFFRIAIDFCLAKWARLGAGDADSVWGVAYYVAFGSLILLLGLRSAWLNNFSVRSASAIHDVVFARILQSPVPSFFDTHTVGEVLNRLARDTEVIDSSVPEFMLQVLINWWQVGFIFALAIWAAPFLVILLVPLAYGFLKLFRYFASASRDLKRLESVTRSPIYSSLSETLGGLETIRAFGATPRFLSTHRKKMSRNLKIYLHLWLCMSWVTARLEIATSLILFAVAILAVSLRDSSDPVSLGLALSYGLQLTALFQRCIQVAIDVATYMTSVERVLEYESLESEHSVVLQQEDDVANVKIISDPAGPRSYASVPVSMPVPVSVSASLPDWPSSGAIEFRGLSMRFRENTPLVLRDVSFQISAGERVGVCGRTGSGKSSLLVALFRIVESCAGTILVNGVDTKLVPLAVLRKRISIIPQDPVLLTGSLRFQLDPFGEHTDAELLQVLESVNLQDLVASLQQGLLEPIAEGGENLSQGQRQLLCIARALLRHNKILVIDEGTSSVDPQTDAIIQQTLRDMSARHNLTVISIAHRLSTVLDFDKILCLSDGQVREYGSPADLLARPDSLFSAMVASQTSQ